MNYFILGIIVLFGAIQGFTLCLYLLIKRKENRRAFWFYVLFLFSLSFFNLIYAFLVFGVEKVGFVPVASFPFPYKYLIGVGLHFYVKSLIDKKKKVIKPYEYLLFAPAFFYGCLRLYWYINLHFGIDEGIFRRVYLSGFFTYNEFVYLSFNVLLILISLRFLRENREQIKGSISMRKNWDWYSKFVIVFLVLTVINILHQVFTVLTGNHDNFVIYSLLLLLNSTYIYGIGFVSFSKSSILFKTFQLKEINQEGSVTELQANLEKLLEEDIFALPQLKVADLAEKLAVSEKELSTHIHEKYEISFTDFINLHRVEKVKKLLLNSEEEKYTLVAIAEKAGFSSKSSFNAIFKKTTGLTPTQYKRKHHK